MKQLRIFSIISCSVMISYLLFFSFSGISIASDTQGKSLNECLSSCKDKGDVCINMTADSRRCTAVYQECVDACKKESDSSSSIHQKAILLHQIRREAILLIYFKVIKRICQKA